MDIGIGFGANLKCHLGLRTPVSATGTEVARDHLDRSCLDDDLSVPRSPPRSSSLADTWRSCIVLHVSHLLLEFAGPNTSFQRTLTRGGFGPLNSDR